MFGRRIDQPIQCPPVVTPRWTPVPDTSDAHLAATSRQSRHILMIAPTSFFADYGCHVRILEEARVLQRLGQRVTVVTYYTGRNVDGLEIRRTPPIPWRKDYEVGSSRHKLGFDAFLGARTFLTAKRRKPDIIHGHLHEGALIGGVLGRVLGLPVVFDYQGSLSGEMIDHGFLDPHGQLVRTVRALERRIDRLPDEIVTSSGNAAVSLQDADDDRILHVRALPDCVNARAFRPDVLSDERRRAERSVLGIPPDRQVVVYLGLLARHQGTDLLLHAARRVVDACPQAHFLVMGFPGPHVYQGKAQALGLEANTTFTGRVPYELAPERLALGDVAVAPKISATEGNGKILNYMAMGLPTVAFDLPVCHEYLRGDGHYAEPGDAASLADTIVALLEAPAAARACGERLRRVAVADYDWINAGEVLLDVYDGVMERKHAASRPAA